MPNIIQQITPPIIYRIAKAIGRRLTSSRPQPGEQSPEWYDQSYQAGDDYGRHYTESRYYFLWTVIADRLCRYEVKSILDIGCGPGQFAAYLYDRGIPRYIGLDFSQKSIELAKQQCPHYAFEVADIFESRKLEEHEYDCIVTLEFLEHVERDLDVIKRIKPGTRVIASVPNFPYVSHVRHFMSCDEVAERYGEYFDNFTVDSFLQNPQKVTYYLIDGIRK